MAKRTRSSRNLGAYAGIFLVVFIFTAILSNVVVSQNLGKISAKNKENETSEPISSEAEGFEADLNSEESSGSGETSLESEPIEEEKTSEIKPSEEDASSSEESSDESNLPVKVSIKELLGVVVPKVQPTGNDYFKNSIFVGDGQIAALRDAKPDMITTNYALGRNEIDTEKTLLTPLFGPDGKSTLIDQMKKYKPDNIYIMLGGRSLSYMSINDNITFYKKFIDKVKTQHPNSNIFIHSILPVTKNNDGANSDIQSLNKEIIKMCEDKNLYYLNLEEVLIDSSGYLKPEYALSDGQTLNIDGVKEWEKYLKSHWLDF